MSYQSLKRAEKLIEELVKIQTELSNELGKAVNIYNVRRCAKCNTLFIPEHGNVRCCSTECSRHFQLECKRRWWDEHGEDWRATRRQNQQ